MPRSSSGARLARELHDETGQALTSILLGLQARSRSRRPDEAHDASAALRELVVATLQDVRRLAVELRPNALDDFGLVPALERLAATFARADRASPSTSRRSSGSERLPAEVETALYRIVQEALTNVVKHAQARQCQHRADAREGRVAAVVEDDGGASTRARSDDGGFGLVGMRERVALARRPAARSSRRQAPGTTIVVEVPLR